METVAPVLQQVTVLEILPVCSLTKRNGNFYFQFEIGTITQIVYSLTKRNGNWLTSPS